MQATQPHIQALINKLIAIGATEVVIDFDGSGDSGAITDVSVLDGEGKTIEQDRLRKDDVSYPVKSTRLEKGQWIESVSEKQMDLSEALECFCYEQLDASQIDWYNNDGGYGSLTITIEGETEPSIRLEINQRYVEVTTYLFSNTDEDDHAPLPSCTNNC
jgi:hypothetical protein